MWDLLIDCKLNESNSEEPELLQVTKDWFKSNIPELDYTCVFDIEGDYVWDDNKNEIGDWVNESGTVAIGDLEFYNEEGTDSLEEGSKEYEIAYLENQIRSLEFYILLSELEENNELEKLGIISFDINDGAQFGYRKKTEYAKLDLAQYEKELSDLQIKIS